jgi:DNA invertase Pin-like site-specific DNA recombinase
MSSPSTDNNTCKVKANVTNTSAKQSHSNLRPPRRLCVVLYAHVNGRDSEQLRSLAVQLEILRRHSCREGWTIVGEFADAEAGDSVARPGLRHALSDAQDGQYDILLVYALDRLARSVRDAASVFDELDQAGVLVLSVTDTMDITSLNQQTWLLIRSVIAASQESQARVSVGALIPVPGEKL